MKRDLKPIGKKPDRIPEGERSSISTAALKVPIGSTD